MMAEADTVSNTSSTVSSDMAGLGDIAVTTSDGPLGEESDSELQAAATRLHTALTLVPDADIAAVGSAQDSDSMGAASTSSSSARDPHDHNDSDSGDSDHNDDDHHDAKEDGKSEDHKDVDKDRSDVTAVHNGPDQKNGEGRVEKKGEKNGKGGTGGTGKQAAKKSKNPLKLLKKLTKFDKPKKKDAHSSFSEFEQVRIDKLPQVFVAKYLGMREVKGFCGLHHVRRPVDEMVSRVQKSLDKQEQVDLPLVYVVVSPKGLDVREHKLNKQKEGLPVGLVPIDFISYGVQDIKYWRVFTFIVVRELSSRSKVTECHAYLCDSSLNARKMALSLGASFKVYSRGLKKEGKVHNFQVELRPPDALAEAVTEEEEA